MSVINVFVLFIVSFFSLFPFRTAKPIENVGLDIAMNNKTVKRSQTSDIIFPDDDVPRLDGPPACARDSTYCEHFGEYPKDYVRDALEEHHVNEELFGIDTVPEFDARDNSGDTFVCRSRVMTIFPKVGKNIKNDWRIIINQGEEEGYVQGVVIETCIGKNRQCELLGDVMDNYVTACKQKYIYRRLLSLSDSGKPVQDTFRCKRSDYSGCFGPFQNVADLPINCE